MKFSVLSLVVMLLVAMTYTRSLTPNDVPDPPKTVGGRMPPIAAMPHVRAQLSVRDQKKNSVPVAKAITKSSKTVPVKASPQATIKSSHQAVVKVPHQANVKGHHPPVKAPKAHGMKDPSQQIPKAPLHSQVKVNIAASEPRVLPPVHVEVLSHHQTNGKDRLPPPAVPKANLIFERPAVNEGNGTTLAPPVNSTLTTTLDPWEEFCKEACEAGMAGPECDCAGHPIGRRHAPLLNLESDDGETYIQ